MIHVQHSTYPDTSSFNQVRSDPISWDSRDRCKMIGQNARKPTHTHTTPAQDRSTTPRPGRAEIQRSGSQSLLAYIPPNASKCREGNGPTAGWCGRTASPPPPPPPPRSLEGGITPLSVSVPCEECCGFLYLRVARRVSRFGLRRMECGIWNNCREPGIILCHRVREGGNMSSR